MFRVDNGTVNTLAGSILFLRPQTTYEVNLILSDLEGGSADTVETITTRTIPCLPAGGRTFHVIPGAGYLNRFQCNNNLWISMQDRYCWEDSSDDNSIPFWGENLNYDGFDWGGYQYALKWKGIRYADLDAFFNATGLESHGVHVNKATCFESLNIPSAPPAAMPFQYLTLNPDGNAVDAGTPLAGINDDYVGGAPDLGAYEVGAALPYFGVRVIDFDADGDTDGADLAELTGQSTGLDIRVESFAGRFGSQVKMLPADG